jgi:hypothetical protein
MFPHFLLSANSSAHRFFNPRTEIQQKFLKTSLQTFALVLALAVFYGALEFLSDLQSLLYRPSSYPTLPAVLSRKQAV